MHRFNSDNREPRSFRQEVNIPEEEVQRIVSAITRALELGICAVYGDEDPDEADAEVPCGRRLDTCKAICCTFQFALTKDEVRRGQIKHDSRRPFFIAHEADRYCHHLNRDTLRYDIWEQRPLRCRRYDCSDDPEVRTK